MYIQITTRCNMRCAHCCYSCTTRGQDMPLETFRNALKCSDDMIALGGGEPTIHPLFWQMLGESLAAVDETVWLATNGKETQTAVALARMAKKGIIGCALSLDEYHSPIDEKVIAAFTRNNGPMNVGYSREDTHDGREIRDVSGKEVRAGRCKTGTDECCCSELIVKPDGSVYGCGCKGAPCFGNVNTEVTIPDEWQYGECYRDQE